MKDMRLIVQIMLIAAAVGLSLLAIVDSRRKEAAHGHSHKHSGFAHKHDGSVFSIDYYAYASKIRDWSPKFKGILAISCLLLCIILNNIYVSLAVIYIMGYLIIVPGGLPFKRYLSLMTIPIVFMIFGSIAIAIGVAKTPVGEFNLNLGLFYIYCSKESLLAAGKIIFKAYGAVSAMYMLTLTTPASEIISLLRSIHLPDVMIELMNMIYRYIFLLMDTQCRMKNSAVSRLGYVDFKTSLMSFGQVAGNLLVISLKKGTAYYQALESRCYTGQLLFYEEEKPVTTKQIVMGIFIIAFLFFVWFFTKA